MYMLPEILVREYELASLNAELLWDPESETEGILEKDLSRKGNLHNVWEDNAD